MMRSFPSITAALLFFLCGAPLASAATKAPAAPSNLAVKTLGVNAFQVTWKDNSKNETGWEIRAARKGGIPLRIVLVPTANITSYTVTTNDLAGAELLFQMTAYNGVAGKENLSKPTATVSAVALSSSTIGAPTMLLAKTLDDGRIRLSWKDNATSENGYQIETRLGTKKWTVLGSSGPGLTFSIITSGYLPSETRSFRVRGFKANKFTSYSNVATATTKIFQAPSQLVVTALPEGSFSFKWKDRSAVESGFELQSKLGSENFESLGESGANTTASDTVPGFTLSAAHQFRVRAFRLVGAVKTYSGFSNVFSIQSTPLAEPITLAVTATTDRSATLTWVDESARENGFEILYRVVGTTPFSSVVAGVNAQTYTVGNLASGAIYEFRVSAVINGFFGNRIASSGYKSVQARSGDGFTGDLSPLISLGNAFSYSIQVSEFANTLTGVTVSGLPAGLVSDSGPRTITGTPTEEGIYTVTLKATFSNGSTSSRDLILRIFLPPTVANAFTAANVAVAATSTVSVTGKFSDPGTTSAARIATTFGTFDIILFSIATPLTVDNFIDYVDAGEYANSFFHRSPADFVVQGGGFKHTTAGGFTRVTTFAPVNNEPGISNLRGTVAMAKLGGDPNSATSQFFVNINNNAANLDAQNGGFTVFGRIPEAGMIVVDRISALPVRSYNIPIGAEIQALTDVPVNAATAPSVLDPAKLVKITSVGPAPLLTYTVLSQNPAIATASLTDTNITITGVAQGVTTIQVKAIDLDGNSVTQNIAVTVP